ncbi:MAG: sulfate/molybdate ABC transporter ATP-binding protein [Pseudanabaenaceae cyanobacterium SKYGB_i_bin29]|nr:sulfate/molybdate ABC transporter ATP-binding protein [Pseudanabaenaceae cyanobacterium SKYG29]MDW8422220.1 sulfate/molybdate ABC transporter ATP-binding protein [Pseudanabaenaceae cyanobacterium SKYGB_i_bin29]
MELIVDIEKQLPHYNLQVSFALTGETLGILGSSGSGKSMTLRCIAGIANPTQGKIILNGRTLYDSTRRINVPSRDRKVGFVFQNYALFPHLTVAENIAYGLRQLPKPARQKLVYEQLEQVHLSEFAQRYPHQLSGGQQQRVALARALAPQPDLLLLDEPFSALDTHLRNELEKQLIKTLATFNGLTLFVTHNLEEAYRVCQKLLVIDRGQVVAFGDKQTIFAHPGRLVVAQLTGCKNFSPMQPIDNHRVKALAWGCTLQTTELVLASHTHVGIRAHQITFLAAAAECLPNTFPAWPVWTSETPHRMTIYLKLGTPPIDGDDYHLQAEVFKERWQELKDHPQPWIVHLRPDRINLLS